MSDRNRLSLMNKIFKKKIIKHCRIISKNQEMKSVDWGKIDTPNTQIYDGSHSWLGTFTSIKSEGIIELQ